MDRPHAFDHLAGGLAAAFLAGDWSEEELVRRGRDSIRPSPRWMRRVATEVLAYADDLVLSGPRALGPGTRRIVATAAEVAREEGFRLNHAKTRTMGRGGRQQVCGIVVNEHPNAPRREYDELKAILHNAARHGPDGENRAGHADFRAHLLGRIAWVEQLSPLRARKLHERFARIDWRG